MIIEERIGNRIRHYSDKGRMIRQQPTGILYEDALDIIPCPYTYEETDVSIEFEGEVLAESVLDIVLPDIGI